MSTWPGSRDPWPFVFPGIAASRGLVLVPFAAIAHCRRRRLGLGGRHLIDRHRRLCVIGFELERRTLALGATDQLVARRLVCRIEHYRTATPPAPLGCSP